VEREYKEYTMKIMARFTLPALTLAIIALATITVPTAFAFDGTITSGAEAARGTDQTADLFGSSGVFKTITNVLLYILGAISVIMIIIGGLRYVISGGNSTNVTAAKNTILYAIVGVIIAILSYAIINFVLGTFTSDSSAGTNV
jgi:hypothetical protein